MPILVSRLSIRESSFAKTAMIVAIFVLVVLLCPRALTPTASAASKTTTTITLVPGGQSTPLNSSNGFWVDYVNAGKTSSAIDRGGILALTTDVGTTVTISGISTGSGPSEEWVLDEGATGVSFASGSPATYYYYDVLLQPVSYAVVGGGSPPSPSLVFFGPPQLASGTLAEAENTYVLSRVTTQTIQAVRGSNISLIEPLAGTVERWATKTSSWIASSSAPIPFQIIYFHQYFESLTYSVTGGGSGYSAPEAACSVLGSQTIFRADGAHWVDANTACSYVSYLPGSTSRTEAWNLPPSNEFNVTSPGTLTPLYYHQYFATVNYTVSGGGLWSRPELNVTVFGTPESMTVLALGRTTPGWLDAGSLYSMSNPLPSKAVGERWSTPASTYGLVDGPLAINATYYHQFLISVAYSVPSGGAFLEPSFNFSAYGLSSTVYLSRSPQFLWADSGSVYQAPQVLGGSNSTARWFLASNSGIVGSSLTLTFTYLRQFLLYNPNGPIVSAWFYAGTKATVTLPNVYARVSGIGLRITSYSIDGQPVVPVPATGGNTTFTLLMDRPHQLVTNTVVQYQVVLEGGATTALASITSPTIPNDNHWYDAGTAVTVVLNGAWGRVAGSGERLASYSVDGVSTSVSSSGAVHALSTSSISSPHTLGASVQDQFELTTVAGSVTEESAPPIAGDRGWYDSGTNVTVTYNYSWSDNGTQRLNALSWQTDNGPTVRLAPSGAGTFTVYVVMDSAHTIQISAEVQFQVLVSGGNGVSISPASRTNDTFFDKGSTVSVTTDCVWDVVSGNQRMVLTGLTVDGRTTQLPQKSAGTYTTSSITVSAPVSVSFQSVQQYLVSFDVRDGSGKNSITPSSFKIGVPGSGEIPVANLQAWLDRGANFSITSLVWEGEDVKPTNTTSTVVSSPLTDLVKSRVYEGELRVTDFFGFAVSGARVRFVLANGTDATRTTGKDGTISLGMIPLGPFSASISSMGMTSNVSGNAALNPVVTSTIFFSYPMIGLVAVFVVIAVLLAFAWIRLRRRASRETEEHLLGENWQGVSDQP